MESAQQVLDISSGLGVPPDDSSDDEPAGFKEEEVRT
jgi:hypothetical protein